MELAILIIGFLAGTAFIAVARENLTATLAELLMFLIRPLGILLEWITKALQTLARFIHFQLHEQSGHDTQAAVTPKESTEPVGQSIPNSKTDSDPNRTLQFGPGASTHELSKFIGSVVFTVLTALFGAAEFYLVRMGLAAMMGIPSDAQPAFSPDSVSAAAMLAVSAFWGLILVDVYRGTYLFPERFLLKFQKPLKLLAWTAIVGSLIALIVLAVWRGQQVAVPVQADADPIGANILTINGTPPTNNAVSRNSQADSLYVDNSPSGFNAFATIFFPAALAGLVCLSMAVSFTGVIYLLRYIGLLVLAVAATSLLIFLLPLRLLEQVLLTLNQFLERLINLLARLGMGMVNTLGPPLVQFRAWIHSKIRNALGSVGGNSSAQLESAMESESNPTGVGGQTEPDGEAEENRMRADEDSQNAAFHDFNWGV